jgi:hypothetical protein
MSNQHPITPPPDLRKLWAQQAQRLTPHDINGWLDYVATQAAQWGADQELEACCAEVSWNGNKVLAGELRNRRRPKPPTLKEQALLQLDTLNADLAMHGRGCDLSQIRRALEELPND